MAEIPADAQVPPEMRRIDESKLSTGKYGAKTQQDFPDPIVRCDSCQGIVHRRHIRQLGCCSHCGNRRFRNVRLLNEGEMGQLVVDGVDAEYLELFEGVELG